MARQEYSVTAAETVIVVLTTRAVYVVLLILTTVWRLLALAHLSTFDGILRLVIGPIACRVVLGKMSTRAAGGRCAHYDFLPAVADDGGASHPIWRLSRRGEAGCPHG
jgi:hypothetical protein